MRDTQTIYAPLTPVGGAVSLYRLSGPEVLSTLRAVTGRSHFQPRHSYKVALRDQSGVIIDPCALLVFYPAPHSYTGEDVAEISLHAGKYVSDRFCFYLHHNNLRLADPGEFSRRAVLYGKMTLEQALGVRYLIESKTQQQYRAALAQMTGQTLRGVHEDWDALREHLLVLFRDAEASLEFPDEDDISKDLEDALSENIKEFLLKIKQYHDFYEKKEMMRTGISVVLVGPPNVGKSSLLNALAREDYAMVSDIPGTTRDVVQVLVNWGGYAVRLMDTAGLRETSDPLESMGIQRTRDQEQSATITLLMLDRETLHQEATLRTQCRSPNVILVLTKADVFSYDPQNNAVIVSAQSRHGLQDLEKAVLEILETEFSSALEQPDRGDVIKGVLDRALVALKNAFEEKRLEIRVQILYDALKILAPVMSDVDQEEVLDRIFSGFCIGK
ncbi:MAG: tRNA uridine-5-carboxymethylaminomethyl(34) synthesis GTPase MnmE [Alphaproteobacteria bacterium]